MQEWYVIFRSYQGNSSFLRKFLKVGFGHVSVIKKSGNMLIIIDPLTTGVAIDVIRPTSINQIFINIPSDMKVLHITLPTQNKLIITHFANYLPSCVTCAKALLGVRSWSLTPYGLYKNLQKLGATSIV
jgi:hypothetical protein